MGLFSYVPNQLFSVFTGSLKQVHADLLFIVYEQYRKTIYTIDRETIIDLFIEYLETMPEEINMYSDDNEDSLPQYDNRERAFYFLRKFIDTEWLIQEQDFNHSFNISLPDYSLRLLETLQKIMDGYQMEFRGHVLAIYQNLTGEEGHSFVAVHQAYEMTLQIIDGLKSLNHNIKRYTEKLLQTEDVQHILEQIFDEYEVEVLGAHYYRLKSSDHVSKYRTRIMEVVRDWQYNRAHISEQARVLVQEKQAKTKLEGENVINDWLKVIEHSFDQMDDILEEIDARNRQYASAASQQVRLHIMQSGSMEGKINKILTFLAEQIQKNSEKARIGDAINKELALFNQNFIDIKSVRLPTTAVKKHKPKKTKRTKVKVGNKQKRLDKFKQRVADEVTVDDMNKYVWSVLDERDQVHLSEMPLHTKEDWVKLIYSVAFSTSKRACFHISETDHGQRTFSIESGIIPNRHVVKKRDE